MSAWAAIPTERRSYALWPAWVTAIPTNTTATISASVRWQRGSSNILLRLRGNHLELATNLVVPASQIGTPGRSNSVALANVGPAIYDVSHSPIVPLSNQIVLVTARFHDRDGVTNATLKYRVDPSATFSATNMVDDGSGGDATGGDGVWSARIAGQALNKTVAFFVEIADRASPSVTNRFPAGAPARECLVRFGDVQPAGSMGVYRLWMTQATASNWTLRSSAQINNQPLDVTFVYGTNRVIYNAGAAFNGSDNTSELYNNPTNKLCGYEVCLPKDDRFLGSAGALLDWPRADETGQREQIAHWISSQMELPFLYRRLIRLVVNGVDAAQRPNSLGGATTAVYEDTQEPDSDFLEQWYPDADDGDLYKLQVWRQSDHFPVPGGTPSQHTLLTNYTNNAGNKHLASYRWNWRKRSLAAAASPHQYTNVYALVDAVMSSTNYVGEVESLVDVEQWMRVFALERVIGNIDAYSRVNGHNMYAYKPNGRRWSLIPIDLDIVLGLNPGDNPPTTNLFANVGDPRISGILQTNAFQRAYWRGFQEAVNGPLSTNAYGPVARSNYVYLLANGVKLTSGGNVRVPWDGDKGFDAAHEN